MRSFPEHVLCVCVAVAMVALGMCQSAALNSGYGDLAIKERHQRDVDSYRAQSEDILRNYMAQLEPMYKRGAVERRHASVSPMCNGRPLYMCNDTLMSVWLRHLKNPDYSNE